MVTRNPNVNGRTDKIISSLQCNKEVCPVLDNHHSLYSLCLVSAEDIVWSMSRKLREKTVMKFPSKPSPGLSLIIPLSLKSATIMPVLKYSSSAALNDFCHFAFIPIIVKCFERLSLLYLKSFSYCLDPINLPIAPTDQKTVSPLDTSLYPYPFGQPQHLCQIPDHWLQFRIHYLNSAADFHAPMGHLTQCFCVFGLSSVNLNILCWILVYLMFIYVLCILSAFILAFSSQLSQN